MFVPRYAAASSTPDPEAETETQLADIERQGGGMAKLAHTCATFLLLAFSLGSLLSISAAAFTRLIAETSAGHLDLPDAIDVTVGVFLVLGADVALLYAASVLRVLTTTHAPRDEMRVHIWAMVVASLLESSTYLYLVWTFDKPTNLFLWGIGFARALSAPPAAAYLSMARPLPVGPRDVRYQASLAAGRGLIRDVARLAGNPLASLARKAKIYTAAATMTAADFEQFQGIIAAVSEEDSPNAAQERSSRSPETPPEPPRTPDPEPPATPEDTQDEATSSNVRTLTVVPAGQPGRRRTARADAGRPTVARAQLRAKREEAALAILAEKPNIGPRELGRRVALATKHTCSESTAHELLRSVQAKAKLAATIEEARAAYNVM